MLNNEPNWTYRDLLSCTLAEIDGHICRADNAHRREDSHAKAMGAVSLWLRLTDEARNPEDLNLLMARIDSAFSSAQVDR